ncbi:pyrroloquinoline quinone biosynthesis peptide chaperone PqqD [Thalassobius vesicularis]|uniref:Pyrroloquinoline quinone biosynthesis peptide chaperone PqqD n=1 Tax=Thalassobius vesicularis TaxID=1294297 RepID=A0A4S3M606_9RHOB|nr:pyrroloquinoline quinone biosynthesis peptide chaperone PqqD [Thalassobius vesicularis]THD71731.1 pyrroloquinoline quinone biosynthesis peptide chaperone PqqD [Thalassobius vesicularis]
MSLHIAPHERPYLPRGVRLMRDKLRDQTVLLAPEKAVALDMVGEAILTRVNGVNSLDEIVTDLAQTYNAPRDQIAGDVQRFLQGLRARIFLRVHP